jgi:hypothetical protein
MIGQQEANMIWSEVRQAYPNRWLIIEAVEAYTLDERRILDKIAVMEACRDNVFRAGRCAARAVKAEATAVVETVEGTFGPMKAL